MTPETRYGGVAFARHDFLLAIPVLFTQFLSSGSVSSVHPSACGGRLWCGGERNTETSVRWACSLPLYPRVSLGLIAVRRTTAEAAAPLASGAPSRPPALGERERAVGHPRSVDKLKSPLLNIQRTRLVLVLAGPGLLRRESHPLGTLRSCCCQGARASAGARARRYNWKVRGGGPMRHPPAD